MYHNFLENQQEDDVKNKRSKIEYLDTDRKSWNVITETRGSIKHSPTIKLLNKCFGELITDEKIANFLNYKVLSFGRCFGPSRPYSNNSSAANNQPQILLRVHF